MAQLTVRGIPDDLVRALRVRAAQRGRSAEAEHRVILAEALGRSSAAFWERAEACRRKSGKQRSDSASLLRAMRDER
jgi:antitoxin FitA